MKKKNLLMGGIALILIGFSFGVSAQIKEEWLFVILAGLGIILGTIMVVNGMEE